MKTPLEAAALNGNTSDVINMKLFKLNKVVLSITNPDKLLGNIASNTLDQPKNALLDRFGKIIVTFDQIILDENLLILIESQFLQRFLGIIEKYSRFTNSLVTKTMYKVYYDSDNSYSQANVIKIKQKIGNIILTEKNLESNLTSEEFTLFRVRNNIPIQGIDYDDNLLLTVSEDFVSYSKGCFIGQEIIARVHYKSKPPKILKAVDEKQIDVNLITSKVKDPIKGLIVGFSIIKNE